VISTKVIINYSFFSFEDALAFFTLIVSTSPLAIGDPHDRTTFFDLALQNFLLLQDLRGISGWLCSMDVLQTE